MSHDEYIDPVGSCVGQRGVRVSTVMSELGGEKIDIIEWSENPEEFIEDALSPAQILNVKINEKEHKAVVKVSPDQQSLAIGKGGQNARLAAKLTGWKIDIQSTDIKANKDKENKKGGVVAIDKTEAEVEENTQKEEKNIGEGPERKEEETDKNE